MIVQLKAIQQNLPMTLFILSNLDGVFVRIMGKNVEIVYTYVTSVMMSSLVMLSNTL